MNPSLQQRLKCLNQYIGSLTSSELGIAAPIHTIKRSTIMHGDHNLIVKLHITDIYNNFHLRCLRLDASDSPEYKKKEYTIFKILEGYSIAPHVYSFRESPPMLVCEWIEDVKPLPDQPGRQRNQWIKDCANLYNTMHAIPIYEYLEAEQKRSNSRTRYEDFIQAIWSEGSRHFPYMGAFKRECLEEILKRDISDLTIQTTPSITQLSPKTGNLVLRRHRPFFLDWDTARFTDKERDIALFIGVHLTDLDEVKNFFHHLYKYNHMLVSLYLQPVMLWRDFRGGYRVTPNDLCWLEKVLKLNQLST